MWKWLRPTVINVAADVSGNLVQAGWIYGDVRIGSDSDPLAGATTELAGLVWTQWHDEAARRGLFDPDPLAVPWSMTVPPLSDHPHNIRGEISGDTGAMADLVSAFRALPRRRLVVLGVPGSGKTSLAILFVLELLKHWQDSDQVPMLFSLSSWDPAEHIRAWMLRTMSIDYPILTGKSFGPRALSRMLDSRRILPILDGMDELPEQHRQAALVALNEMLGADSPLILGCRHAEYAEAVEVGDVLRSAAVIEAGQVPAEAVAKYFRSCVSPHRMIRWPPILDRLADQPTGPLASALANPFAIMVAKASYARADPVELADSDRFPTAASINNHLLDRFVPSLFAGQSGRRQWPGERAQRWLSFLAAHLTRLETTDFVWWQLRLHAPRWRRWVAASLTLAATSTLLTYPLEPGEFHSPFLWTYLPVVAVAVGGFIASPVPHRKHRPRRVRAMLTMTLISVLAVLITVLAFIEADHVQTVIVAAAVFAAELAGLVWLVELTVRPRRPRAAASPATTLAQARRKFFRVHLPLGLILLAAATMATHQLLLPDLVLFWTLARSQWLLYSIARLRLALLGWLPLRLMTFLRDAWALGALRQIGAVYQFRHALLQERLSATCLPRMHSSTRSSANAARPK